MYANILTLGSTNYDLVSQNPYRSMRSNSARPVSQPQTLTISHETTKTGTRSSVLILEDIDVINTSTSIIKDSIKAQFKLSFKPYSGRTDIETVIAAQIAALQEFLSVPANIDKFINQES